MEKKFMDLFGRWFLTATTALKDAPFAGDIERWEAKKDAEIERLRSALQKRSKVGETYATQLAELRRALELKNDIIDLVRTIMDNGTGKAETFNENVLIKLMQINETPIETFKFDQERVEFCYGQWRQNKAREEGRDDPTD